MRIPFRFRTLSVRITILVALILAAFSLALGIMTYTMATESQEERAVASLEALASSRRTAVEAQLRYYVRHIRGFLQPQLDHDVSELLGASGAERRRLTQEMAARLRQELIGSPDVLWAQILDRSGGVIATTRPDAVLERLDEQSTTSGLLEREMVSAPFLQDEKLVIEVSSPLRDAERDVIGVLLLRLDARALLGIVGSHVGLGETGETVLGVRRSDHVYFLTPARFDPALTMVKPVPIDSERAGPMIHATAGLSGVLRASDYRGVKVVAVYGPIEPAGWGLVAKQDEAEVFGTARVLRRGLTIGLAALLVVAVTVVLPATRSVASAIGTLEQAARDVGRGALNRRVQVIGEDEIARLTVAFNAMIERLGEARLDLERSNRELESFAHVVSHDLKAPLRGIRSLSDWLEDDLADQLSAEGHEQLTLLRLRVDRMDALINGLLEYSRVGRRWNPETRVDTGELAESIIDSIGAPSEIEVDLGTEMPVLHTDNVHLEQVFRNLVSNAVTYHHGSSGRVEIGCRELETQWEFYVSDDGPGIEPRYHDRIFRPFESLDPTEGTSTGIGLALVKKIVEEHGGTVHVESEGVPGEGATFRFTWPKSQ